MESEWIQLVGLIYRVFLVDLIVRDQLKEPDEPERLTHGSSRLGATDHEDRGGVTMDCALLRHGIAVERDEWERLDTDRPLTER